MKLFDIDDVHNCTTCEFSREFRKSPVSLEKELRCMFQPVCIGIPVALNAGQMTINVQTIFAPVHAKMICAQWRHKNECPKCQGTGQESGVDYVGCTMCGGYGIFPATNS